MICVIHFRIVFARVQDGGSMRDEAVLSRVRQHQHAAHGHGRAVCHDNTVQANITLRRPGREFRWLVGVETQLKQH